MSISYLDQLSTIRAFSSIVFFIWYVIVLGVACNGFIEILRKFKVSPSEKPEEEEIEGVTIIRPIKGIDPEFDSCLESSFLQNYPKEKLQILLCVDDPNDASIPIIEKLMERYSDIDSKILISEGYDSVKNTSQDHFGPNPKVNNLAKGFLNAKHDILWIMDVNVWAGPNTLRNSVKALNGNCNNGRKLMGKRKVKLVHHVPIALSISSNNITDSEYILSPTSSSSLNDKIPKKRFLKKLGARLDEMFLLTSHSKFYVSLNNLAIAPCVNGKSNIYRKSDLDKAVALIPHKKSAFFNTASVISAAKMYSAEGPGSSIKLFARYIGEDNMIAIALWENLLGRTAQTGDIVIQPLSGSDNSINDYIQRRVRWLRVRKFMVFAATLVEPTTESIICGIYGTYAISTLFFKRWFIWKLFIFHLLVWILVDFTQYHCLLNSISKFQKCPKWLDYKTLPPFQRSALQWSYIWCMREILALPIWLMAMAGHKILWRGRPFKIKKDLTAEDYDGT